MTLLGLAEKTDDPAVKRRFLARHPEAEFYADFHDFSFWRLKVEGAHYIGGFGRIVDLTPEDLCSYRQRGKAARRRAGYHRAYE